MYYYLLSNVGELIKTQEIMILCIKLKNISGSKN